MTDRIDERTDAVLAPERPSVAPDEGGDDLDRVDDDRIGDDVDDRYDGDVPLTEQEHERRRRPEGALGRAGRRVVRRPVDWWERPWDTRRVAMATTTAVTLVITTLVMMRAVHFWPFWPADNLVLRDNTPNGGDMGAHVWGPAYLRDVLLPSGRVNGWTMDWYAGMPAYRFYMVLPALAIVALDVLVPYGIAFKLVAISGLVLFPFSCWCFGRLARFRYPIPELFAFAGLVFALDESFSIYGGNLKSTMAGEFSFSIAMTLTMIGLGLLARGLETGKYRIWAAIVLAAAAVCHGIVLIYIAVTALALALVWVLVTYRSSSRWEARRSGTVLVATGGLGLVVLAGAGIIGVELPDSTLLGIAPVTLSVAGLLVAAVIAGAYLFGETGTRRRMWYAISTGVAVMLLAAWWVGPFLAGHDYMTDMKYEARPSGAEDSFWDMFFPYTTVLDVLVTTLAVVGLIGLAARRHLTGVAMGVTAMLFVAGVYVMRDSLPTIGLLWNPRLLPLLYLLRYLLMAVGVVELVALAANLARNRRGRVPIGWRAGAATLAAGGMSALLVLGFVFEELPGDSKVSKHNEEVYAWGPFAKTAPNYDAEGDGWSRYNFSGYEGKPAYPEYRHLVDTMGDLGQTNGCGRAFWEHAESNGSYGSPMALMLLPFWTDGCIGSMEGLFFEASGTTPYHFLATAAMSESASNPVRKLRYSGLDASVGVPELQSLGVRYVMLRSDAAKTEAATNGNLAPVTTSGPWTIYELRDSDVVEPLDVQPVVVAGRDGDQRERNLELGTSWFQSPQKWRAMPADGGPAEWQRISVRPAVKQRADNNGDGERDQVDVVRPANKIRQVALDPVTVSDVDMGEQSLSFRVDRPGVPVLVKVSYFPNWATDGADGPWRIGPNMMVVVPTDTEVTMRYEQSSKDYLFYALTLLGVGLCLLWRRRGDIALEPLPWSASAAAGSTTAAPAHHPATLPPPEAGEPRLGDHDGDLSYDDRDGVDGVDGGVRDVGDREPFGGNGDGRSPPPPGR